MPDRAYTVSPVYSDDDGSYQGSEVTTGPQLHNGMVPDWQSDFVEDEQGRFVFQGAEEDPTNDTFHFDEGSYIAAALDALPVDHSTMVNWAAENLSPELIQYYDNLIDGDDLDSLNEALEFLTKQYLEANPELEQVEEEQDISDEEFTEAFETLNQSEPLGTETAYAFLEAAEQSEPGAYQDALILSAAYHRGEIDAQDAFEALINKYGVTAAAKVYRDLTSN